MYKSGRKFSNWSCCQRQSAFSDTNCPERARNRLSWKPTSSTLSTRPGNHRHWLRFLFFSCFGLFNVCSHFQLSSSKFALGLVSVNAMKIESGSPTPARLWGNPNQLFFVLCVCVCETEARPTTVSIWGTEFVSCSRFQILRLGCVAFDVARNNRRAAQCVNKNQTWLGVKSHLDQI